jgi:hypothetical protein
MPRPIAPIHAIPSPGQQQAAADLASLPVEMLSRSTSTLFTVQTALLFGAWQNSFRYGQAVAEACKAVGTAGQPAAQRAH